MGIQPPTSMFTLSGNTSVDSKSSHLMCSHKITPAQAHLDHDSPQRPTGKTSLRTSSPGISPSIRNQALQPVMDGKINQSVPGVPWEMKKLLSWLCVVWMSTLTGADVWPHFIPDPAAPKDYAFCSVCRQRLACKKKSTSGLIRHWEKVCGKKTGAIVQKTLTPTTQPQETWQLEANKRVLRFIVMNMRPLTDADSLDLWGPEVKPKGRKSMKAAVLKIYEQTLQKVKEAVQYKSVCVILDMWSDCSQDPYLLWKLRLFANGTLMEYIMPPEYMPGTHTNPEIGTLIQACYFFFHINLHSTEI
ncbi:hypothetical protein Pelo_13965 [Pelomyxa schiedti]|nr:hypothetical protein Pelo_13965 [Pelomyxa schiedti]